MGKTVRVTNVVVLVEKTPHGTTKETMLAWEGAATQKRLEAYVIKYIESLKPGGVNEHISESLGYVPIPTEAVIKNQNSWNTKAHWKAPAFLVF